MSLTTRILLVPVDDQTTQVVSRSLEQANHIEIELAPVDQLSRDVVQRDACWDAVIVCAGGQHPDIEQLLTTRQHLGFCPIVVVASEAIADERSLHADLLTRTTNDFSPRALQLLLRGARELKDANSRLASLEATVKIKTNVLAKQNEFIHDLTSRLCHEVRSPLTAARQYTSLISRQQVDGSETPQVADRALRSLDDLSMLVDDMAVLSQWDVQCRGLRRKVTSLPDIISETEHLLRDRARIEGIHFEARFDSSLPDVFADPDAVGQAVRNLVVNSLQHAGKDQRVQLWAEADPDDNVIIGIEDQFGSVDETEIAEAFSEFCDADISLTSGLQGRSRGLAVARRLLELNLSELRLESVGKHGSVFVFQLPSADPIRLINHYLTTLGTKRPRTSLSLITFSAQASGHFPPGSAIDDFLQTSTAADDFVWQTGPLHWVALLCGSAHEVRGRLRLLDAMWAARRERDQWLNLPAIRWQQHDSWMRESNDSKIATQFLNVCGVEEAARSSSGRVLVVDNHPERVLRLTHQLEVAGYDVLVARDGETGVSSAAKNQPDAIVLDSDTSESNEISTLQQLRRQDTSHAAPIIMLASNMRQQQQALEHGAKAIFDQSLHASEVVQAVQRSLADKCEALVH